MIISLSAKGRSAAKLAVRALGAVLALVAPVLAAETPQTAPPAPDKGAIERGEYLARVGDCVACHTQPGGKLFAGGSGEKLGPLGRATGIGDVSRYQNDVQLMGGMEFVQLCQCLFETFVPARA